VTLDGELKAIEERLRRLRILRMVPDYGSGDSVSPHEVTERLNLGMTPNHAATYFRRLRARGLVVRLRPGAYQLAPKTSPVAAVPLPGGTA
jgi:hypothetical protein